MGQTESGNVTPEEARRIAREAYVYGFPLVDNYRILHSYFSDPGGPEFKAPWNTLSNVARVFTPEDRAIQTANSDTPYSFLGADLRAEPLVLTVPPIEEGRYVSLQFIDLATHNFAYVGSRTTGNGGGNVLLAGPGWSGETPPGIDLVIPCETELAFVVYRTQLFDPDDLERVKAIQARYRVQPLSAFLGQPAPPPAPPIDWMPPLSAEAQRTDLRFFDQLGFVLGFCPTHPSETALRERLARLGIGPGRTFDPDALAPDIRAAVAAGVADAWADFDGIQARRDAGELGSADVFGDRDHLRNDYLLRMTGAVLGIYGNSAEEAIYPTYFVDADGRPLDAAAHRYSLRMGPGELPPVNAFWSLTMYGLPDQLLVDNPLDRYLVNSPMLPDLLRDADGGVTVHVQRDSPGPDREANWLPAPDGPFFCVMRLYWPQPAALDGTWSQPPLARDGGAGRKA